MPKKKADVTIGHRMAQELWRLFPNSSVRNIAVKIGCERKTIWEWEKGTTPSAIYIARLHALGGDVMWVLTGTRYALVRYLSINSASPSGYRRLTWTGSSFEEECQ